MLTIYFKDGTERNFDNESGILIKETLINGEIKSILTFNYEEEDYFGDTTKRKGVFFTDETFGFCQDSKRNEKKQRVVVDVNAGEYVFNDLDAFRIARESSEKEAVNVDDATYDDFRELEDEWCEFWFGGKTKYTRMDVKGIHIDEEEITILCVEKSEPYFLDEGNNQIWFN